MIGFITLGTNDFGAAVSFYDQLLSQLGWKRLLATDVEITWAPPERGTMITLLHPFDKNAASPGNGQMVGLMASSKDEVCDVYAKALELGAQDEGTPGQRSDNFYAAYFRDLDGHKFCVALFT